MKRKILIVLAAALLLLTGCSTGDQVMDNSDQVMGGEDMVRSYTQITQEEAKEMMAKDDGHIVVDVRRQDEYDAGHITGMILIPNGISGRSRQQSYQIWIRLL